jgi:hypothetical protein
MTTKHSKNRAAALALTLAFPGAAALVLGAGCGEQPKNRCKVAPGLAVAFYQRHGTPTGTCDKVRLPVRGESLGMQPFVPNPTAPSAPDTPTLLAIKPVWLGERIADARDRAGSDPALKEMAEAMSSYPYGTADGAPRATDLKTTRRPYALGRFTTVFPDDNGVCRVPALNVSDLVYPLIPAHTYADPEDPTKTITVEEQPETSVKYVWKNVRVVQVAQSPGTQTFADLTITRDGCTASYSAAILVPRVSCGKTDAAGKTVAEPKFCNPDPNETNLFGSGISQGVPYACEDLSSDPAEPEKNDPANPDFVCVSTRTEP